MHPTMLQWVSSCVAQTVSTQICCTTAPRWLAGAVDREAPYANASAGRGASPGAAAATLHSIVGGKPRPSLEEAASAAASGGALVRRKPCTPGMDAVFHALSFCSQGPGSRSPHSGSLTACAC